MKRESPRHHNISIEAESPEAENADSAFVSNAPPHSRKRDLLSKNKRGGTPPRLVAPGEPDAKKLAEEDLARSGLSLDDAAELGAEPLTRAETRALGHGLDSCSILFRYWDPFEQRYTPEKIFHRVRYLESPSGFAAQQRPQRYSQPAGSLNDVYVPRLVEGRGHDWKGYLSDARRGALYFTEGEKKAAAACRLGVPCLALGGVDVWRAATRGADELPLLSQIDLKGRDAYVVFDTDEDAGLKPEVLAAAHRFMEHLLLRGATPSLVVLPAEGRKKTGLDDYLRSHTADELRAYALDHSQGVSDARALCEASARFVFVKDVDRFVSLDPAEEPGYMSVDHLDHVLSKKQVTLPRMEKMRVQGGGWVVRPQPAIMRLSDALLTWGGADKYACAVYRPGEPRILIERGRRRVLNLWTGWRCEYDDSTLPPAPELAHAMGEFSWALDNVFADDPIAREFVEHWLYYPLRHPGAKLNTFALVCSRVQGIGKSFIGHMLAKHVYGLTRPGHRHAWQLSEGDLHNPFNPYLNAVSFVEGDDIAASEKKSVYERVKSFVTSDTVQVNMKGVTQFMIENRANFWLTSNEDAPFFLADEDRRAFVHVPKRAKKDDDRYRALELLFERDVAGKALLWHARERYSERGFNPRAPAPITIGKLEVGLNGRGSLRDWAFGLIQEPESLTRPFGTPRELYALMQLELPGGERYSTDAMGHALRDAGATRWSHGAQAMVRDGPQTRRERVWVVGGDPRLVDRKAVEGAIEKEAFARKPPEPSKPGDKVVQLRPGKKY